MQSVKDSDTQTQTRAKLLDGAVIAEQKTVGEQTRYRLDIAASEAKRNGAAKNQGAHT